MIAHSLLFTFSFSPKIIEAAVFDAPDVPSLISAINTANSNLDPSNTINLSSNATYDLTAVDNVTSGPNGLPSITSTMIINGNGSSLVRGGGAPDFRFFHIASSGDLELNDMTLTGGDPGINSAGAIFINQGELRLNGSLVTGNTAAKGGAIFNFSGTLGIASSTLSGNSATSGSNDGGAILIQGSGSMTVITDTTLDDNHATNGGGGAIYSEGSVNMSDSTISRNTSNTVGGAWWGGGSGIVWNISNSTISGNSAGTNGGAFFIDSATVNLNNVTLTNNMAINGEAGGINSQNAGNVVTLRNTILAKNIDQDDNGTPDCRSSVGSALLSAGFNILGDDSGCSFTGMNGVNGDQVGTPPDLIDPLLDPLSNYGGPTETHRLQNGSPAINAGNDVVGCQDQAGTDLTTDQRLFPRPGIPGGRCDIGAFEAQAPTADLSSTALNFGDQATGTDSAVQSITMTNNGELPLDITSIDISGPFSLTHDCGTTLAPGASCTLSVIFQPTAIGAASGEITINDNAQDSPQKIALSGNGVASGTINLQGGACSLGKGISPQFLISSLALVLLTLFVLRFRLFRKH